MTIIYSSSTQNSPTEAAPGIRFQVRDNIILSAIHEYGGVLAKRHLQAMFWPNKTPRAMEKRLSKLYHANYIDWPSQDQRKKYPIPEPVCWLGWNGAVRLAVENEIVVEPILSGNENQQRKLERRLRSAGFRWTREPRWIQLDHDLAVVDFRLLLESALRDINSLSLTEWVNEGVFRSDMDIVELDLAGHGGSIKKMKKGVCPDAYFVINDEDRRRVGQPYRARFLLELDRATHDNPSFGLEKALPGAAYIHSAAYKKRFGHNSGHWLVVTTAGERRMRNLMHQTQGRVGQDVNLFSFTTFDQLKIGNLFTSEIWYHIGPSQPVPLLSGIV